MVDVIDALLTGVLAILMIYIVSPIDFLPGIEVDDTIASLIALFTLYQLMKKKRK